MSPSRLRPFVPFAAGLLAITAVVATVAVPVVGGSDWWNTRLRVATEPPPRIDVTPLPGSVREHWSVPGRTGQHNPVVDSTVITTTAHGIVGHDPITGQERWHYQRNNVTLCDWVTVDGAVVAAFRHEGGCVDMVALDGGTGQRRWYRTADLDADATLSAGPGVVVAGGGTRLVAFYTDTGQERWTYTRAGCGFGPPVAGDLGVAVVLSCHRQGQLLALHDLVGKDERWSVPVGGTRLSLLAANERVALYGTYQGREAVTLFDSRGAQVGAVTSPDLAAHPAADPAPDAAGPDHTVPTASTFLSTLVVWTGSHLVAVDLTRARIRWSAPASGPAARQTPTVVYPDDTGFVERGPSDGQVLRRATVEGAPAGPVSGLARVGGSIVATGTNGTIMYG